MRIDVCQSSVTTTVVFVELLLCLLGRLWVVLICTRLACGRLMSSPS